MKISRFLWYAFTTTMLKYNTMLGFILAVLHNVLQVELHKLYIHMHLYIRTCGY